MAEQVTYVRDGTFEGEARVVLEKRNGRYCYVWHGYYDGGTLIKLYPKRPYAGVWDKVKRKPMTLSIYDVKLER